MIIFYNKKTGRILGRVEGRKHNKSHLNMWVGDQKEVGRIIVEWAATGKEQIRKVTEQVYEKVGVSKDKVELFAKKIVEKDLKFREMEPQTDQKDIFIKIDKDKKELKKYKVDIKTKKLILSK